MRASSSRLSYGDADYFNLSEKDSRIAKSHAPERVPSLEQINHVLGVMPTTTDIERRNRALIAFAILTGCRDNAIASLKLKHVDLLEHRVHQDAREVRTKFAKTIITTFFPVGDLARQIVETWVEHLRLELQFGPDDPLFPATRIKLGASGLFESSGVDRRHWSNASPIRAVFHDAFIAAGLPYFNPHSVRKTLVQLGQRVCRSPEEYKAWSQNLGHEGVMTTFTSYGSISPNRQAEIIRDLACVCSPGDGDRTILAQIRRLANRS
jgi:integrase